jgi:hypothetical protein
MDWTKLLVAAGGTVAVGAALYFVCTGDDEKATGGGAGETKKKPTVDEITKEQVQQILQEIIKSQDQMKGYMKELTKELLTKSLKFDDTYKRVKEVQPSDPLEKYGLSMMDFDTLLDKHQGDPAVRECIAKIMGAPNPSTCTSDKVQGISVKKIIDVHTFMQEELDKLVTDFHSMPNKDSYDMKTVTIAAQAIVGSKIEDKFGITSEDIESAVLMHHAMLATSQEFANINIKIQHIMGKLMGAQFAG